MLELSRDITLRSCRVEQRGLPSFSPQFLPIPIPILVFSTQSFAPAKPYHQSSSAPYSPYFFPTCHAHPKGSYPTKPTPRVSIKLPNIDRVKIPKVKKGKTIRVRTTYLETTSTSPGGKTHKGRKREEKINMGTCSFQGRKKNQKWNNRRTRKGQVNQKANLDRKKRRGRERVGVVVR